MDIYRLATARRANDLTGTGVRLVGGRWNHTGSAVLYTAGSRALTTLEILVHSPLSFVPDTYRMLTLRVPDDSLMSVPLDQLPDGWDSTTSPNGIKDITAQWLSDGRFMILKVPSAVVAGDYNFLLNPAHRRFGEVVITDNQPYLFDSRLLR